MTLDACQGRTILFYLAKRQLSKITRRWQGKIKLALRLGCLHYQLVHFNKILFLSNNAELNVPYFTKKVFQKSVF